MHFRHKGGLSSSIRVDDPRTAKKKRPLLHYSNESSCCKQSSLADDISSSYQSKKSGLNFLKPDPYCRSSPNGKVVLSNLTKNPPLLCTNAVTWYLLSFCYRVNLGSKVSNNCDRFNFRKQMKLFVPWVYCFPLSVKSPR